MSLFLSVVIVFPGRDWCRSGFTSTVTDRPSSAVLLCRTNGGNTVNQMTRNQRTTLRKTLVIGAFALTLLATTSVAFDLQESAGAEHHLHHHDELTFTQI